MVFCQYKQLSRRRLTAANLGDDADTTAAICGQVAGAHYGISGIPSPWLEKIAKRRIINRLANQPLRQALPLVINDDF